MEANAVINVVVRVTSNLGILTNPTRGTRLISRGRIVTRFNILEVKICQKTKDERIAEGIVSKLF